MLIDDKALHAFHPLIVKWFTKRYGSPTDIQAMAWEKIRRGEHILLSAPTGSGKTLAAFLWAINQLVTGAWPLHQTSVLYISPLKALNNDISENLLLPLKELQAYFDFHGKNFPSINVKTRSGDTPQAERQRMIRRAPEILITTPESLNLIISSKRSRLILTSITTIILDEIHAIADNKRGTHLISAVDRIVPLSGEFQRIGLSATIRPLQRVADFIAGFIIKEENGETVHNKREVKIIHSNVQKRFDVEVLFPHDIVEYDKENNWWPALISEFISIIKKNRSTLFFANNRKLTEKISRLINDAYGELIAYSHHGSLSKEIRHHVEQKLKKGELKAIVATSSLELGIDIGTLDEVILIQAPFSIAAGVQRVGRSGHSVGDTSRARIYPLFGRDLINCSVMAKGIMEKDIEEIHIPECPLDVLAQVILSMVGVEQWDRDRLFCFLRSSYSFNKLTRRQYDMVLEMLAGRYSDSRIRELRPRISIDNLDNTVKGKAGVLQILYLSGGTIPDRGYYNLRLSDTRAKLGELDEEFVWERHIGDTFTLGTQSWKITRIDHQDVHVVPHKRTGSMAPFWRAETFSRSFYLSEKIALFLKEWNKRIEDKNAVLSLKTEYYLNDEAAAAIIEFLKRQKNSTGSDLPHRNLLVIEHFADPLIRDNSKQIILHTLWGGQVNLPFFVALLQAFEERYHFHLHGFQDNDCVLLNLPDNFAVQEIFDLVNPENIYILLRRRLEKTGFFGARFRENAARALLLPRQGFHKRMPRWLNRLRSKKLFDAVIKYEDFPILAETWRECLQDEFDLPNLVKLLDEIRDGRIEIKEVVTRIPSPFTANIIWQQTNKFIYEDDTPSEAAASHLKRDIIEEIVFTPELRPHITPAVLQEFTHKIQRTFPGYAPATPAELLDCLKERIVIPETEWQNLLKASGIDSTILQKMIIQRRLPGASISVMVANENNPGLEKALAGDEETLSGLFAEWIQFYGPITRNLIRDVWGLTDERINNLLEGLVDQKAVITGNISEKGEGREWCDAQNLEILLRMARKKGRAEFEPLDISLLPLFIAHYQGLTDPGNSMEDLKGILESLWGYPAQAILWETEILPARMEPYYPSWLDTLFLESEMMWFGCGKERVGFCFEGDLELFKSPNSMKKLQKEPDFFPDMDGRYSFWDLAGISGMHSETLTKKLWDMTWKGLISNDRIQVLRKGIENRFQPFSLPAPSSGRRFRGTRYHFNRWQSSRPASGNWYMMKPPEEPEDMVEKEEIIRDRIRILFQRYGVLFREILDHELKDLQWSSVFRSLRIMELSGEIMAGHFFKGISGMQFVSKNAYGKIRKKLPQDAIYWMNAADPASLCGIKIDSLKTRLPSRIPSNHLVFHGKRLVLISMQKGKKLVFFVPPDDPELPKYLKVFKVQLIRRFNPLKKIKVETVNEEPSVESPYKDALMAFGFTKDYLSLVLR
ncbi:MAG: DEAD/DEAH box helicase [bacterium]